MDTDKTENVMDRRQGDPIVPVALPAAAAHSLESAPSGRMSRRKAIRYGLASAAGLAGAGAAAHFLLRGGEGSRWSPVSAEVFKGDAPTGELWELWRKRGWAVEARHYLKLGRNIRCRLCPNDCLLEPGDRGRCRNRVHKDGSLYTLAYANPCSFHLDPIEKKPLFHFLPGTAIFSLATSGCGFRCLNCQNWDISQRKPEETKDPRGEEVRLTADRASRPLTRRDVDRLTMLPEDAVAVARALGSPSLAYTYSEPTSYYEYMYDTCKLARAKGIKNVVVTCGYIHRRPLEELCDVTDAYHVDLKSFSQDIYSRLNSGKLQPVLDTIKTLKRRGLWFEVVNLIVPTYTDDSAMIRRMCHWLMDNVGPDCVLHFSRFHPQHKLTHLPPTPQQILLDARAVAVDVGLRYVYIGNLPGLPDAETTFCPKCRKPLIDRYGYTIRQIDLVDGKCRFCQTPVAGVWKA